MESQLRMEGCRSGGAGQSGTAGPTSVPHSSFHHWHCGLSRQTILFVALTILSLLAAGCVTRVIPPEKVSDPVTVFYADYGVHSSLILPEETKHRYIEYVYGDYAFSAEGKNDPIHTLGALLVSFKSSFGRREHFLPPPVPPDPEPPAHKMAAFRVERDKVLRLLEKLDARYRASPGPIVHNGWNNIDYVPDHEHYSIFNSCNHLTLRSLHDLGCRTTGFPVLPNFVFGK